MSGKFLVYFLSLSVALLGSCSNGIKNDAGSPDDIAEIEKVLAMQEAAWNNGDLEGYMQGYWNNDSLAFIGKSGITYGWQQTLSNYQKSYPDKAAMGQLKFTLLRKHQQSPKSAYIVGKWHLEREAGNLEGYFSLLWRKIKGRWVIVSDHSS